MSMPEADVLIPTDLDEINEVPASPKQTTRRWVWRLGITMVVLSAMGTVGYQVHAFQQKRANTPLALLSRFQDKLMEAFSHEAMRRILNDPATVRGSFSLLVNEKGKPAPKAMGMTASARMKAGKGGRGGGPRVMATFLAQEGKGGDLVKKLQDVWSGVLTVQAAMAPPEEAEMMKKMVFFHAGDGDEAVVTVMLPNPPGAGHEEDGMKEALKAHKPRFTANVNFGHTIGEMYDDHDGTILAQFNGIQAKLSTAFANTLIPMLCPGGPGCQVLGGITDVDSQQKLLYTSKDIFNTRMFPSFQGEVAVLGLMLRHNIPPAVAEPLKGIGGLSQGIKSIVVEGLPYDWQVKATFEHFHPSLVLSSMLNGNDPRLKFLQVCGSDPGGAACRESCQNAEEKGLLWKLPYELTKPCQDAMYGGGAVAAA